MIGEAADEIIQNATEHDPEIGENVGIDASGATRDAAAATTRVRVRRIGGAILARVPVTGEGIGSCVAESRDCILAMCESPFP